MVLEKKGEKMSICLVVSSPQRSVTLVALKGDPTNAITFFRRFVVKMLKIISCFMRYLVLDYRILGFL